jgi:mannose-6-phosphate isomerase-like protein (cupin superfamily)
VIVDEEGNVTDVRVLQPGEGGSFAMGPDTVRVLLDGEATDGRFAIAEASLTAGVPGPPPHVHRDGLDEIWYVLDGELEFLFGDRTVRGTRGTFAFIPAGTVHTFSNVGDATARWIGIFRPASGLTMLEEVAPAFAAAGPPDLELMASVFARHGVEVVGEPPIGPSDALGSDPGEGLARAT